MARKKNPEEFEDDEEIMDYGEEPDFNDPEGFVDDVSDDVTQILFERIFFG